MKHYISVVCSICLADSSAGSLWAVSHKLNFSCNIEVYCERTFGMVFKYFVILVNLTYLLKCYKF